MSEKVSVFIDESYEIEKQKLKIQSNDDKKVSVTILTNKNISCEDLIKYIESDKNKISIISAIVAVVNNIVLSEINNDLSDSTF